VDGRVTLKHSGDVLSCDALLSALGRQGNADRLDVEKANLSPIDPKGQVSIDDELRALTPCKLSLAANCWGILSPAVSHGLL
jgi:pyruvate/2-oxoglutarate dehydrogenase complex dihydrolipoamide dehydrogenase (E3) component